MSPATIKQALVQNVGPVYWFAAGFWANACMAVGPPTMADEWPIYLLCLWSSLSLSLSLSLSVLPYFYHSPRICIYYFAYTIKYHPTEIVHSVGSFCPREKNCFTAFAFTDKGSQKWGQNSHPFWFKNSTARRYVRTCIFTINLRHFVIKF